MKLISHRGNLTGETPLYENKPSYIEEAISEGYDVEIDLRFENGNYYLGHDTADHIVFLNWLEQYKDKLWIHCKDLSSLEKMSSTDFNYFWHVSDRYTVTSKGNIWIHVGQIPCKNCIIVLPEQISLYYDETWFNGCYGICSDVIKQYEHLNTV